MTQVTITKSDNKVSVTSPYSPEFVSGAKSIGGRWDKPCWTFDALDELRVRELCRAVYGTDGTDPLVTIRVSVVGNWAWEADKSSLQLAGRTIARAWGRDSGAKLGEGVILESGRVYSGGSVKNWRTCATAGSVFLVRGVGIHAAKSMAADSPDSSIEIEIVDEGNSRQALVDERARLLARIAEIDAELATE